MGIATEFTTFDLFKIFERFPMGQIFSRHFVRRDGGEREEEDTTDLIEAQADNVSQEEKENCFQYLKRKFTSVFIQQSYQCKKTRLEEEVDENIVPGASILERENDETVVEIETLPDLNSASTKEISGEIEKDITNETENDPVVDQGTVSINETNKEMDKFEIKESLYG